MRHEYALGCTGLGLGMSWGACILTHAHHVMCVPTLAHKISTLPGMCVHYQEPLKARETPYYRITYALGCILTRMNTICVLRII